MVFFTNLDEAKPYMYQLSESWETSHVPRVGEYISIKGKKEFRLKVCSVSYDMCGKPKVELHLGSEFSSISSFEDWWKHER